MPTIATWIAFLIQALPWLVEGYGLMTPIGLAILFSTLALKDNGRPGVIVLMVGCCGMMAFAFHWAPAAMAYTLSSDYWLGALVSLPLIIWEGSRLCLSILLGIRITRDPRWMWLSIASAAMIVELVIPSVFPWKVGSPLVEMPWLIQGIDLFGDHYTTLVACAVAGVIQNVFTMGLRFRSLGFYNSRIAITCKETGGVANCVPALAFLFLNCLYSQVAWSQWNKELQRSNEVHFGLVQVDPSFVESLEKAQCMTDQIADQCDLVCWPESSGGTYDLELSDLSDPANVFACSQEPVRGLRPWPAPRTELLLGGKCYTESEGRPATRYVTAMLINRDEQITARQHKRHLMPFGEYVPGASWIPGLADLFDMDEQLDRGTHAAILPSSCGAKIGAMLCYEDMVPSVSRDLAIQGADVLVSLINGSAFESRYTLYQHRLLAQTRSIECRRFLVRCAATGESCAIDPLGRITGRLPLQKSASLPVAIRLVSQKSIYCKNPMATWMVVGMSITVQIIGQMVPTGLIATWPQIARPACWRKRPKGSPLASR